MICRLWLLSMNHLHQEMETVLETLSIVVTVDESFTSEMETVLETVTVTHVICHEYRGISGDHRIFRGLDCSFVLFLEPNFYPGGSSILEG
jgi:hypothetical protein